RDAVDAALQVAGDVLPRGGVLDSRRRGLVRLPDQSAAVALLHARPQLYATARPHRVVRRLLLARDRTCSVLPALHDACSAVERNAAQDVVLELQYRLGRHGAVYVAAARNDAAHRRDQ